MTRNIKNACACRKKCENHLRKYCQDKIQDNLVLFRPEEQGGVKTASPRCQDCSGSSNTQRMA